ncbi:AAA family ATPase [Nostoc sp. FACHB-87]|uniref:AAA family ATPase n=1 Tax=Nostocaceae TaxID=1162 RepID=UPI001681F129|nr:MULTISPECIES: AAA family ATPase [Nostocaceae]MBD2453880.1 AAA family ATPase [Nostoc sp. FACHB-87]MBD2476003.1 AAA family ATPase [Anabaena sp. FACHB-83]
MLSVTGYRLIAEIYNGARTLVYRGYREVDSLPVVIKLLKNPHPNFSEILSLRNHYTITKNLNSPFIIQTYSLEPYQNGYALVMEDFGGISLQEWGVGKNLKSIQEFLEVAIALCDALNVLYHERIIHKDIQPRNILINPATKQVKLIDFSIASLLPRETQTIVNPNVLEGTLAYISPENTGRMNRGIDYRTDFYSLGITFYQLLTGKLPFSANDPMELLHAHIAEIPPKLPDINPRIPQVIADIVMKMMAKNAEDRYQNALGLKSDLEKCYRQLQATGQIPDFPIAQRDFGDHFIIPDKLYGRENEIKTLLAVFERVSLGATEIMLVAGFSGIGKTAVVNEIHKPILRRRGYFIKGKFDQFNRNIPLSAFVQAFRDLIGQLLTENHSQIQAWRQKILQALGKNAQVIIEVIPQLEKIIGKQPPAAELSGTAAENRFNLLFQKFTQVFTSADHPLVIFLDDLQWVDGASLKLIQLLITEANYLLLIGAYRNNEVQAGHPLMLTLSELQKNQVTINKISLAPLHQLHINQLVADTLKCQASLALPLSGLVFQKTQGNPFFINQFLKALHQNGLITFDVELGCWQCEITQITTQSLTEDVVTFMSWQLQRLPPATQKLLQLAACIGNSFDLDTLAIVSQQSPIEAAANLWKALQEGLVLPINGVYKFYLGTENLLNKLHKTQNVAYIFLHDRVQQAAYILIPEYQKPVIHLKIGQLLLENLTPEAQEERLFVIVNHWNDGITLLTQSSERENLAQLNLAAGRKAKLTHTYKTAIAYFEQGIQLLPPDAWTRLYPLTLALHQEITEVCYLNSDFAGVTKWAEIVCQNAQNLLDTIKVRQNCIIAANVQGKIADSLQIGLDFLSSLGVEFPAQPTQADIQQAFARTRSLWVDKSIESLLDLPPLKDPHLLAQMEVLTVLSSAAYIIAPDLMPLLIFKQVEISIQFGNSPTSVFAYGDYGVVLCGVINDIENGYEFGELSIKLRDRLQIEAFKSRNGFVNYYFIKHWKDNLSKLLHPLEQAYQSGIATGDLESANLNAGAYCTYAYYQGQALPELVLKMDFYRHVIIKHQHTHCLVLQAVCHQAVINLLSTNPHPEHLTGEIFDADAALPQLREDKYLSGLLQWYINQTVLYYLFHQYEAAARLSAQTVEYLSSGTATLTIVIHTWFDALIQLNLYASATPQARQTILQQVQQQQDKLHHWATFAPSNHQHRWELVTAEKNRVVGNQIAAMEYYDRAIANAKTNGFIQDVALANELAAKFYLAWGKEKFAAIYMQEAYRCYELWGAKAKTQDLVQTYPHLLTSITNPTPGTKSKLTPEFSATLDLNTVIKANQTLSREIHTDRLLQNLIQLVITNAGADKAALFWNYDGALELGIKYFNDTVQSLERKPIEKCQHILRPLIHYVERTWETVITDYKTHISTINDPYCLQYQPKSILCTPILNQGQLVAVLYLENAVTFGAFTDERVELLKLLCSQAAISLVNARLYEQSQSYAQQLERSLQERQQAEAALAESEAKFRGLVEGVSDVIWSAEIDGTLTYLSPQFQTIFGFNPDDFIGKSFSIFIHPDDQEQIQKPVRCLIEQGETILQQEFRHLCQDGSYLWVTVNVTPIRDTGGKVIRHQGIIRDINNSKRIEAEQKRQLAILESTSDFVGTADPQGKILYLNQAWRNLLDLDGAEPANRVNITEQHPAWALEIIINQALPTARISRMWVGETALLDHKGREVPVSQLVIAHKSSNGEVEYFSTIARDISDRQQQEQQLKQANAELMRATQLKDEFLATMSHELRTPLNVILGMTEGLQAEIFGPVTEKQLKTLKTIERSGFHLLELINDILDISKISSGQIELQYTKTAVIPLCEQSLELIKPQAAKKSIQIENKLPADVPNLYIDERRIRQVLINLLNNAVKFTPDGGSITIEIIFPKVIDQQNYLQIAITDTGIGIASENLHRVFEPFIQVDSSLSRKYQGTGLGLAIVKRIVELHGGDVTLTSELGIGSCFAIALPY